MMRYTVVWDKDVEVPFINYWVKGDAQVRATLTEVANWVDSNLAENPSEKGQARPDLGARVIPVPISTSSSRVSVTYEVWPDDRQIHVVRLTIRGA